MAVIRNLKSLIRLRRFEWNKTRRRLRTAANINDLRKIGRRRPPRGVFDYIDGAAEDETTCKTESSGLSP